MPFYEIATLSLTACDRRAVAAAVAAYASAKEAQGRLLGIWETVAGRLDQVVVLRGFDSRPEIAAERERARRSPDPFGCGGILTAIDQTSYVPFDFLPPVSAGRRGALYEILTYTLRPAGLTPLEVAWRAAKAHSPAVVVGMYPMDGAPRAVEIVALGEFGAASLPAGSAELLSDEAEQWRMPGTYSSLLRPLPHSPLS